jgi:6,7-dimethyl-8-ribityllumazine synthase
MAEDESTGTGSIEPPVVEGAATDLFEAGERELLSRQEWAVCVSTFYEDLAERLVAGATEAFAECGVSPASLHVFDVPGAFELPLAARWCAESAHFAGIACLGVVIRGETDHYEHVCAAVARGVQGVQLQTGVPCAFGVITCDTREQAEARAGGDKRDQGRDSALAVLRMHLVRQAIEA